MPPYTLVTLSTPTLFSKLLVYAFSVLVAFGYSTTTAKVSSEETIDAAAKSVITDTFLYSSSSKKSAAADAIIQYRNRRRLKIRP